MNKTTAIAKDIQNTLCGLADENTARQSCRFFKTGKGQYGEKDLFLGIRVPVLRRIARQFQDISLPVTSKLLYSPYHETRMMALIVLVNRFRQGDFEIRQAVYAHYMHHTRQINSWDLVDVSAPAIAGGYLFDKNRRPLYALAGSENLWERRIAIVSTAYFIRYQDLADTIGIAKTLLDDREDLIHKATGWMLREAGKQDQTVLETFLQAYCRIMPRTMLRYAIEKLDKTRRNHYLKGCM